MTAYVNKHIIGKAEGIFGSASKRSTSSKPKPARVTTLNKWTRPKIPPTVAFPPSTIPAHTTTSNSQSSHDGAVRPIAPDDLETRLLSKPNSPPKPKPEPTSAPVTESLKGISSISHASSRGGSSSNTLPSDSFTLGTLSSTPPDPRAVKDGQNDGTQSSGESLLVFEPHTHSSSSPVDPIGTLASMKTQSSDESLVASKPITELPPPPTDTIVTLTPCRPDSHRVQ
jgi:hypothetical protein